MKDSKTLLVRHVILSVLLEVLAIIAIALPSLENARQQVASALRLPEPALWIIVAVVLVVTNILLARRLEKYLVDPLVSLVNETKLGSKSYAFKIKSRNAEEDTLKHFVEAQALRFIEMEQEVARMEELVKRTEEIARMTPRQIDAIERERDKAVENAHEGARKRAALEKSNMELERRLDDTKRELKARNRELESIRLGDKTLPDDNESDGSHLALLLAEKLRSPLSHIADTSWRLSKAWAETSPAKVRDALDEINKQAEEQIELLKKYQGSEKADSERDAG